VARVFDLSCLQLVMSSSFTLALHALCDTQVASHASHHDVMRACYTLLQVMMWLLQRVMGACAWQARRRASKHAARVLVLDLSSSNTSFFRLPSLHLSYTSNSICHTLATRLSSVPPSVILSYTYLSYDRCHTLTYLLRCGI
jgi:hypothetical protein